MIPVHQSLGSAKVLGFSGFLQVLKLGNESILEYSLHAVAFFSFLYFHSFFHIIQSKYFGFHCIFVFTEFINILSFCCCNFLSKDQNWEPDNLVCTSCFHWNVVFGVRWKWNPSFWISGFPTFWRWQFHQWQFANLIYLNFFAFLFLNCITCTRKIRKVDLESLLFIFPVSSTS